MRARVANVGIPKMGVRRVKGKEVMSESGSETEEEVLIVKRGQKRVGRKSRERAGQKPSRMKK
jgi:hypothetical protein